MNNGLLKPERLALSKGARGWGAALFILWLMCMDQFVINVPFENLIFPLLIIAAASLGFFKNLVLVAVYAVIFELSCVMWFPSELINAKFWLLSVFIGYLMPLLVYKAINGKHKNMSVFAYSALASLGYLLYCWVSVIATVLIWKIPFGKYFLSDLPFEIKGVLVTFICALPVAVVYKLMTGELSFKRRNALAE